MNRASNGDGWVETVPLADLPEGTGKAIEAGHFPLLLIHREDKVYATGSFCPHEETELDPKNVFGHELVCKEHGYRLDLRNGRCSNDPSLRLATYPTKIRAGIIWVKLT